MNSNAQLPHARINECAQDRNCIVFINLYANSIYYLIAIERLTRFVKSSYLHISLSLSLEVFLTSS